MDIPPGDSCEHNQLGVAQYRCNGIADRQDAECISSCFVKGKSIKM